MNHTNNVLPVVAFLLGALYGFTGTPNAVAQEPPTSESTAPPPAATPNNSEAADPPAEPPSAAQPEAPAATQDPDAPADGEIDDLTFTSAPGFATTQCLNQCQMDRDNKMSACLIPDQSGQPRADRPADCDTFGRGEFKACQARCPKDPREIPKRPDPPAP